MVWVVARSKNFEEADRFRLQSIRAPEFLKELDIKILARLDEDAVNNETDTFSEFLCRFKGSFSKSIRF